MPGEAEPAGEGVPAPGELWFGETISKGARVAVEMLLSTFLSMSAVAAGTTVEARVGLGCDMRHSSHT